MISNKFKKKTLSTEIEHFKRNRIFQKVSFSFYLISYEKKNNLKAFQNFIAIFKLILLIIGFFFVFIWTDL